MRRILILLLLVLVPGASVSAAEIGVDAVFPALQLDDQHGRSLTLPGDAPLVIFAADKAASDRVKQALEKRPRWLAEHRVPFIADISGMPSMITRLFALPAMRERPYSIYPIGDADQVAFIPRQEGQVTVLRLDAGRVTDILIVADESGLEAVFDNTQR